jgi:acetolactate synthase I/II/III large subunit
MSIKAKAGELVARALVDGGARLAFGIPGTHNTELYDALERSQVKPVLVTDEQCASFMADAVSRTSGSVGVANVVPGAGVTHCLSGVAEAYMDNVALLVLTCGIRADTGKAYQLHDVDQLAILRPVCKAVFKPATAGDIYPTVRRALDLARSGTPGPVAVEIPANFYLLTHEVPEPAYEPEPAPQPPAQALVDEAARVLNAAKRPAIYAGLGARGATALLVQLAEKLGAPVATTISGKGVFPESHPLWLWNGFGNMAPPFAREIMDGADALLAIGCRFGEVATGSYGINPPEALVHVDVNAEVFHRNYRAQVAVESDAADFLRALLPLVTAREGGLEKKIAAGHQAVRDGWARSKDRVSPAVFYQALQRLAPKAIFSTDSGNGTFLSMEQLRLDGPGRFIGPIDYSCMGYSVPGAIGAKHANPETDVVALAGDGALLMTGLELVNAAATGTAPVVCVLRDGELGQIVQFQRTTLDRDTCSVLPPYSVEAFAKAVNAEFVACPDDAAVEGALARALELARGGRPVMVDVALDYSERTYFTKGVVKTNFWRLPWGDRVRMLSRAVGRKVAHAL